MTQLSIEEKQLTDSAFSQTVNLITLTNSSGLCVTLSSLGASLWSMTVPEKSGISDTPVDMVLNYQSLADWASNDNYFGITAGRVANRIGNSRYQYDDQQVVLASNEGKNQLHGGPAGVSKLFWSHQTLQDASSVAVTFSVHSADGDQGFPGNVDIEVEYRLNEANELSLTYKATTDKTTPICLTNHAYWNIAGTTFEDTLDLELTLDADRILTLDDESVATGEFLAVKETAYDFTQPKAVGQDIDKIANGYDNYFVFNRDNDQTLQPVASLRDPKSGRVMEILTTELGLQFYSANFLDGSLLGGQGKPLSQHMGICLETHGYPNAVNHEHFPSMFIEPNKPYQQTTVHRFLNL